VVTVVVTGASGFLGRAVVRALHERRGIRVQPVSRQALPDAVRVESYENTPGGDVLIHLAEEADRSKVSMLGPQYEVDVPSTLAELATRSYNRVIYASSVALYGDATSRPHPPDDQVYMTDGYTRVKRNAELTVLGSPAGVVARLANVYGPEMSSASVIATILKQIPGSGPLVVRDTTSVRDFLWIDDAAEGFAALATGDSVQGVFNLSTGVGTSVGDAARLALEIAGETSREILSAGEAKASAIVADYARTRECGWQPRVRLRDGLALLLSSSAVQHR
jgi:nucleoside-diphosphate-sugar epimerase